MSVGDACSIFPVNFHAKWILWNVHVHFDCADSHKTMSPEVSAAIFPLNFHTKWPLWNVHAHVACAGSHTVCFSVLGLVFLLNTLLLNLIIFLLLLLHINSIIFLSSHLISNHLISSHLIIVTTIIMMMIIIIILIILIILIITIIIIITIVLLLLPSSPSSSSSSTTTTSTSASASTSPPSSTSSSTFINIIINIILHHRFTPPTVFGVSCQDNFGSTWRIIRSSSLAPGNPKSHHFSGVMNQFLTTDSFAYPVFVASNLFSLSLSTCSPGHSSSLVSVSQAPMTARNAFAATPHSSCGAENWRELRLLRLEAETATGSAWCWRRGDATGISALIFRPDLVMFFLDVKFYESGDSKFEYIYICRHERKCLHDFWEFGISDWF